MSYCNVCYIANSHDIGCQNFTSVDSRLEAKLNAIKQTMRPDVTICIYNRTINIRGTRSQRLYELRGPLQQHLGASDLGDRRLYVNSFVVTNITTDDAECGNWCRETYGANFSTGPMYGSPGDRVCPL